MTPLSAREALSVMELPPDARPGPPPQQQVTAAAPQVTAAAGNSSSRAAAAIRPPRCCTAARISREGPDNSEASRTGKPTMPRRATETGSPASRGPSRSALSGSGARAHLGSGRLATYEYSYFEGRAVSSSRNRASQRTNGSYREHHGMTQASTGSGLACHCSVRRCTARVASPSPAATDGSAANLGADTCE